MNLLEASIFLLLLLLALPGFCRRIKRPGLLYPLYIVAGIAAGALMPAESTASWREFGQFGFILLLFSVGLEVELPEGRESLIAVRRAVFWMIPLAVPVIGALLWLDVAPMQALVVGAALSSTSVGMAYPLWKHAGFASEGTAKSFLQWMVAIEVLTILVLALAGPVLEGASPWMTILHIIGLLAGAGLAAWIALRWVPLLPKIMHKGLQLDVPVLVLLLFVICAVGNRLGLSAAKTAFVLGLFINRATDDETALSHKLEPLRDKLFVPVFFFGLGMLVNPRDLIAPPGLLALGAGVALFGLRRLLYGAFMARSFGNRVSDHAITAPVLTLGAVAVDVLAHGSAPSQLITWTLAASISLTLCAAFQPVGGNSRMVDFEATIAAPEALQDMEKKS